MFIIGSRTQFAASNLCASAARAASRLAHRAVIAAIAISRRRSGLILSVRTLFM